MKIITFPKRATPSLCPLEGADILPLQRRPAPAAKPKPLIVAWFEFWLAWTKWMLWL